MSGGPKLLVFNETGEIEISQAGGMNPDVIDRYAEIGKRAAFFDLPSIEIGDIYIHRDQVRERPKMRLRIDKTRIKADGMDAARIFGVPRGAQVHVTDGLTRYDYIADGTTLEIPSPIPARWHISVEAFPFMPQEFVIIAE
jgi:hypothetical protein